MEICNKKEEQKFMPKKITSYSSDFCVSFWSFVLADKLAYVKFWFRETLKEEPWERWVPVWSKKVLPSAIRIEMVPLPVERLRLPLVTVTAPVRITRDPLDTYVDLP